MEATSYPLHVLWLALLVACGLIIGPGLVGWALLALVVLLIFPKFWIRREEQGKSKFTGPRVAIGVFFTVTVLYVAWSRLGEPMSMSGSKVQSAVAATLRDPSSADFRNVMESSSATCGEVNGKNAFGALAGFKPFVYLDGEVLMEPEQPFGGVQAQTAYYNAVAEFARTRRKCYE